MPESHLTSVPTRIQERCANHPGRRAIGYASGHWCCPECYPSALAQQTSKVAGAEGLAPRQVTILVQFALDHLWYASPDAVHEGIDDQPRTPDEESSTTSNHLGCCPVCCAACKVLSELMDLGELDIWATSADSDMTGISWWDEAHNVVRRDWLQRSWSQTHQLGCGSDHGAADRGELAQILAILEDSHEHVMTDGDARQPFLRCPRCAMVSYNLNDIREGYCGNCHQWLPRQAPEQIGWGQPIPPPDAA